VPSSANEPAAQPDPSAIVRALTAEAEALGFAALAIAPATTLAADQAAYRQQLAAGHFRGMPWLNEERALAFEPERLLPGARSVLVLAMSYHTAEPPPVATHGPTGQIARYARGRDYHAVIRPRLRRLVRRLEELVGHPVRARLFVDSGPLAERAFARLAGLGWIGRNTLLLHRRLGSWTVLGAILTDLELPTGQPLRTNCGSCDRCLRACPTDAFVAPYVLDASRCIAYLTIEHRGPIPPELRAGLGDWVFGCDRCQEVCPVNRKALSAALPDFAPRPGLGSQTELLPLLELDQAAFAERFRGSAVRRAGRDGFVRNVVIALGNRRDPTAVPALVRLLQQDPSPVVRGHAAWALGQIGGAVAQQALQASQDDDPFVRQEVAAALQGLPQRPTPQGTDPPPAPSETAGGRSLGRVARRADQLPPDPRREDNPGRWLTELIAADGGHLPA
jgi:epoxyqueuosine reductase